MEIKRTDSNVNIYDGKRLILHLDKNGDTFTAVNDAARISAKIEKLSENTTKFSEVNLKKMTSAGKMVQNTSKKWIHHYTSWLFIVFRESGLI